MIASIIKAWQTGNGGLRAKWSANLPDGYEGLVQDVVGMLHERMVEHDRPDPKRITVINYGDYQGTLVVVIGGTGYQPATHYTVVVNYGSCSHCDSFQAARDGDDAVGDMMTLALHIVQKMKVHA